MSDYIDREFDQVDLVNKLNPQEAALVSATKNNNNRLLLIVLGFSALFGIIHGIFGISYTNSRLFCCLYMLVCNAIAYYWFVNDANNLNYPITYLVKFSVVAIGGFAIFYYLFRSRRFPRCLRSFGTIFLLFLISEIAFGIATLIVKIPITLYSKMH